jgi:hypothetical protein
VDPAALAVDPEAYKYALQTLAQEEGLKKLVEIIRRDLNHTKFVAAALKAVLSLMAGPRAAKLFQLTKVEDEQADENARKAYGAGVLGITLEAMKRHAKDCAVQAAACGVLWAMTASPDAYAQDRSPSHLKRFAAAADDIRAETFESDGIQRLIGALEGCGTDPLVVEAVLSAMWNLMHYNDDNKVAIINKDGIERVIELVERHPRHASLQESAIFVLHKLANTGPIQKARLKKLGVEAPVLAAMKLAAMDRRREREREPQRERDRAADVSYNTAEEGEARAAEAKRKEEAPDATGYAKKVGQRLLNRLRAGGRKLRGLARDALRELTRARRLRAKVILQTSLEKVFTTTAAAHLSSRASCDSSPPLRCKARPRTSGP